jgi:hypothetical protein
MVVWRTKSAAAHGQPEQTSSCYALPLLQLSLPKLLCRRPTSLAMDSVEPEAEHGPTAPLRL